MFHVQPLKRTLFQEWPDRLIYKTRVSFMAHYVTGVWGFIKNSSRKYMKWGQRLVISSHAGSFISFVPTNQPEWCRQLGNWKNIAEVSSLERWDGQIFIKIYLLEWLNNWSLWPRITWRWKIKQFGHLLTVLTNFLSWRKFFFSGWLVCGWRNINDDVKEVATGS